MLNTRFYALMGIYIVQLLILIYLRIYFLNVMKNIVKSYKKVKSTIPNKNSFDPDICGSKRPTYPEKESNRFEELIQKIESLVLKQDNLDDRALLSKCCYEIKVIYRALKQENEKYKETLDGLNDVIKEMYRLNTTIETLEKENKELESKIYQFKDTTNMY